MADETTDVKTAETTAPEAAPAADVKRKVKGGRLVLSGIVHVDSTFNNTRVAISDQNGNILS